MKYSLEHIAENIRKGNDREVLQWMYKEIYPKVEKYVSGNSGCIDDCKDVFQESIIIFYKYIIENKYDRIVDLNAFLMGISRNVWINKVRKLNREVDADLLEHFEETSNNPLIALIMSEKWNAYKAIFEKLGEKCRELLSYSSYERLNMKEIAEKMGFLNENVAKTQNYRCKQKLLEFISANEEIKDLLKS